MQVSVLFLQLLLIAQSSPAKPASTPAQSRGAATTTAPKAATPAAAPKPAAASGSRGAARPPAAKAPSAPAPAPALTTDEQKSIYAVGLSIYESLEQFALSPAELEIVKRALTDAAAGKPVVSLDEWEPKIGDLVRARSAVASTKQKDAGKAYADKYAASNPGTRKTESGMLFRETSAGTGASPKATDRVTVHYRGTLIDGSEFDSSYRRNQPATFPLNGVIRCWTEGVQMMKTGGKATLVCPSDTAYGDGGRPSIPGGATLVFDIELLEIPN